MSETQTLENNALSIITELGACQEKDGSHGGDLSALTSPKEECILRAYDRLLELELESSLLRAQDIVRGARYGDDSTLEAQIKIAEREMLESKAAYSLRNNVIETVLMTDPILKAVHSGANATPDEQRLLPHIQHRDLLSIAHTNLCHGLSSVMYTLTTCEAETVLASRNNTALAQSLTMLTDQAKSLTDDIQDLKLKGRIEVLQQELKVARSRWRTMKSIIGAIVAGSGVDWARDVRLRELVADNEENSGED